MIINKCFNYIYYSNHSILFADVIFTFFKQNMYSVFFKPLEGIVRILHLHFFLQLHFFLHLHFFLRSYWNSDISLFLRSNWNSDISLFLHSHTHSHIAMHKPKVVILTSGFLDWFPVFELLLQTSKNYTAINHSIDQDLWDDLRLLDADMRVIIERLKGISDPYLMQTLSKMETEINTVMATKSSLPNVNGLPSYTLKYLDLYISTLRVEYLGYLVQYMSEQEVQCFEVTRDTMVTVKSDFNQLYKDKVEASQILSNLNHSKLNMEVRWLLLNKPFNP